MHAVEWNINAMVNKITILNKKLNRSQCDPLIRNFSNVPIKSEESISYNHSNSIINYHHTRINNLSYF